MNSLLILFGKFLSKCISSLNIGNGSTWPGHIALILNPGFVKEILKKNKIIVIVVAGTNGKTTTTKMLSGILTTNGKKVIHNSSGANLLNGIASVLLLHASLSGKIDKDIALFEVDENMLPIVLREVSPKYLLLLNLFRDQLDRYGEVRTIAHKWKESIRNLPKETTLIINADDPEVFYLHTFFSGKTDYFGLHTKEFTKKIQDHAVDSIYCPHCGEKLLYKAYSFSHLGDWECTKCGLSRPKPYLITSIKYPLSGTYNKYNTLAAATLAYKIGFTKAIIEKGLKNFQPAFGRGEKIQHGEKSIQIFLSKNPTGFNESLQAIKSLGAKYILFILNDRIPDGKDVSWIWDIAFEEFLTNNQRIFVSGDRAYDMGLRIKYALPSEFQISNFKFQIETELKKAVPLALQYTPASETLYILPTYSAMLDVRNILTGRKVL